MIKKASNAVFLLQQIKMIQQGVKLTDPIEIAIINRIALYEAHKADIAVSNVIKWDDLGSAATLHGRLLRLLKRKFVIFSKSEDDARLRFVNLAPLGLEYYTLIGEAMAAPQKGVDQAIK